MSDSYRSIHLKDFLSRNAMVRARALEHAERDSRIDTSLLRIIARSCLCDDYASIRAHAVEVLGIVGTSTDIPFVRSKLEDKDWLVRASAVSAFASLARKKSFSRLVRLLEKDPSGVVRKYAYVALADHPIDKTDVVIRQHMPGEKDQQALIGMWSALWSLGDESMLDRIMEVAVDGALPDRVSALSVIVDEIQARGVSNEVREAILKFCRARKSAQLTDAELTRVAELESEVEPIQM